MHIPICRYTDPVCTHNYVCVGMYRKYGFQRYLVYVYVCMYKLGTYSYLLARKPPPRFSARFEWNYERFANSTLTNNSHAISPFYAVPSSEDLEESQKDIVRYIRVQSREAFVRSFTQTYLYLGCGCKFGKCTREACGWYRLLSVSSAMAVRAPSRRALDERINISTYVHEYCSGRACVTHATRSLVRLYDNVRALSPPSRVPTYV